MKYFDFELIKSEESGRDKLNNPIYEKLIIGTYRGRFTPWTADDIAVEGRELTSSTRKLLTKAPANNCAIAGYVRVDGTDYEITNSKNTQRWRILYVKGWHV